MDDFIPRNEHEEFAKRLDAENDRQNKRIGILEKNIDQLASLTTAVERVTLLVGKIEQTQEQHAARLSALEGRDGEKWRQVVGYVTTAIIGIVLGFVFTHLGM